jgi:excisionase family DNA binding protein
MDPLALTIADTVELLGVGKTTIYKLVGEGRLSTIKIGRRTLVLMTSVSNLIESGRSQ